MHLTKSRTPSAQKQHWATTIQQKKSSSKLMPQQQALGLPCHKTRNQSPLPAKHLIAICQHRKRTRRCGVWMRALPRLPLWLKFCSRIRPQAAGVYTDKNLVSATPRLQRMQLRLQPYGVTYRPGKQMHVADALSRLSSDEAMPIPDLNVQIHDVCPQFSNQFLQKIQEKRKRKERNFI